MHLIKKCPSCNKNLRFPIDRGRIKVRCSCGYSFVADPDDTLLYKNASFDLSYKNKPGKRSKSLKQIIPRLIEKLINFRYKLQNFKLLPASEQRRIIVNIILFIIIIVFVFYLLFGIQAKNTEEEGIVLLRDYSGCSSFFL